MKKRTMLGRIACLCLASSLAFASCSLFGDDDDNPLADLANKILPKSLAAKIPAALAGDMPSGSIRSPRATGDGYASGVVDQLRSNVAELKMELAYVSMYAAVIDELLYQNKPALSQTPHTGETIELTDDLVDKMASLGEDIGAEGMEGFEEMVGQEIDVPEYYYKDPGDGVYNYCVLMEYDDTYDGVTTTCVENFFWSSDKTKVKMETSSTTQAGELEYSYTITYDSAAKTSAFIMKYSDFSYTLTISEDGSSTKNGAYVFYETKFDSNDGTRFVYSAKGYADDDGGCLNLSTTVGSGFDASTYTESVTFDTTGATSEASSDNAYVVAAGDIDETITGYAESAQGLAGDVAADFSVETKTYTLPGIAANADVMVFNGPLSSGGSAITSAGATFETDIPGFDAGTLYVGSGYAPSAGTVSVFIDCFDLGSGDPADMPATGTLYLYTVSGDETSMTLALAGTIAL